MDENENILDKLNELFGRGSGQFNILQEQIDIDLQMEYFEYSREIKKGLLPSIVMEKAESLFSDKLKEDEVRKLLAQLASVEEIRAYRILEKYYEEVPDDYKHWAALAMQESRMMLESKLLDENQVLISTGLGGKGGKLRYFVVLLGKTELDLSPTQQKVIKNEFNIILQLHNSEVENIQFEAEMATIKALVPMDKPVKAVFEQALFECNTYGDFLRSNFIITNVKELSFEEIRDYLEERRNPDYEDPGGRIV